MKKSSIVDLFIIITLVLFSGSFYVFIGDPHTVNYVIYSIYLVIFLASFKYIKRITNSIFSHKILLVFFVLLVLSALASDFRNESVQFTFFLLITAYYSFYLTERYSFDEWIEILSRAFLIAAVLSIIYSLFVPTAVMQGFHEGAWNGIYEHKNRLGLIMTFAFLLWVIKTIKNPKRIRNYVYTFIPFMLIILSKSATALMVSFIVILLIMVIKRLNFKSYLNLALLTLGLAIFVATTYIFISNYQEIMFAIGKDPTLTGRTKFWPIIIDFIKDRPLTGYGHAIFWLNDGINYMSPYWDYLNYIPTHAHNGFLDVALDTGILGLFIFLLLFVGYLVKSNKLINLNKNIYHYWLFSFLVVLTVYNFSESYILQRNNLIWILIITTFSFINKETELNMVKNKKKPKIKTNKVA